MKKGTFFKRVARRTFALAFSVSIFSGLSACGGDSNDSGTGNDTSTAGSASSASASTGSDAASSTSSSASDASGSTSGDSGSLVANSGGTSGTDAPPVFQSTTSDTFPSNLFSVVTLQDQSYAFASVSQAVVDGITTAPGAVIAILKKIEEKWQIQKYVAVNSANQTGLSAFGLALSADESVLAVALGNKGLGLLDVQQLINGTAVPTYVTLYTGYKKTGSGTGAIAVAAPPDNKHFFVADEYGESDGYTGIGDVAVVSYSRDAQGNITAQRLGYVKTGQNSIPSLSISPDGKTLYIPNEVSSQAAYAQFAGLDQPTLAKQCGSTTYSGSISVVDVDTLLNFADANPGTGNRVIDNVVLTSVAAGCNAVRVAVSKDGKIIWNTVRTKGAAAGTINAFDAGSLRTNPGAAYLYSFSSNGPDPVGISTFGADKYLVVANSNRFNETDANGQALTPNISIFDVSVRGTATLLQTLESGQFPREVYRTHDDRSVFVTNWTSGTFQQINIPSP